MLIVKVFYLIIHIVITISSVNSYLLDGIYCGTQNCYDVLSVTRQSSKSEISKSYRQLAKKYHPDLHHGEDNKKEATELFKEIATAYEILKDEEARADYDYMLDNPDEYYAHYYRYYRRRVAPKVDVRLVLAVTITIISVIQYYSAWQRYESAIKYFMTLPKYRYRALDVAKHNTASNAKKGKGKVSKTEQKEELDRVIRKVIEENMDIKGAYAKPEIYDVLWIQLLICPYTISKYILWYISWICKFTILKKPYGEQEKLYLIRKYLKMGELQFDTIEEDQKQEYLSLELWIKENFIRWQKAQDEDLKKTMAESARYKAYRRYMKNHGPSRMTFDDS